MILQKIKQWLIVKHLTGTYYEPTLVANMIEFIDKANIGEITSMILR